MRPVKSSIDTLPDNVLLNVFSHLSVDSLEHVAMVCTRWNYLANTPELWIFMLKKFSQSEKLSVHCVLNNENSEEIDWKQVYIELLQFANSEAVKTLKIKYIERLNEIKQKKGTIVIMIEIKLKLLNTKLIPKSRNG